ncbi:hypothetical protein P9112_007292 [Eukaryota sp. TZLM1-RC]
MFQIPDHAYLSPLRIMVVYVGQRLLFLLHVHLLVDALNEEISKIDVEKWSRCFLQSFNGNIPEKNLLNLKYTLRTLQKRLTGMAENDLYNNICSSSV